MLHPDTWSYGDEEAKLFSISVVSQENFRIYWSLWVCSPWDETSPGRWLTPPLLPDSLFHILWISQLVSEFTSLQTWNICDIKHSWLSNRSVINDRTEEVITEDLFWTLNRPVFIILASLKMSLLFIYRSPWWLIDGFVIRVAWKTGTENSEFKFRLRTGLHAHTHTHTHCSQTKGQRSSLSLCQQQKKDKPVTPTTQQSPGQSPPVLLQTAAYKPTAGRWLATAFLVHPKHEGGWNYTQRLKSSTAPVWSNCCVTWKSPNMPTASVYQTLVSPGASRDALLTISCCTNKSLPVLMRWCWRSDKVYHILLISCGQ